jgi:hypothetical protein
MVGSNPKHDSLTPMFSTHDSRSYFGPFLQDLEARSYTHRHTQTPGKRPFMPLSVPKRCHKVKSRAFWKCLSRPVRAARPWSFFGWQHEKLLDIGLSHRSSFRQCVGCGAFIATKRCRPKVCANDKGFVASAHKVNEGTKDGHHDDSY